MNKDPAQPIENLQTPLAKVRGLGSAHHGTDHWWSQRVTAIALIPLGLWFIYSLFALSGADYDAVYDWVASPAGSTGILLIIGTSFYHAFLGIQVVFEDYIHSECVKLSTIVLTKYLFILMALIAGLAVLHIAFD